MSQYIFNYFSSKRINENIDKGKTSVSYFYRSAVCLIYTCLAYVNTIVAQVSYL